MIATRDEYFEVLESLVRCRGQIVSMRLAYNPQKGVQGLSENDQNYLKMLDETFLQVETLKVAIIGRLRVSKLQVYSFV